MPKQRPHLPHQLGPRAYRPGRWWHVDLRPWGLGRPVMRDPSHPQWPDAGERTEFEEVAERWRKAYWRWTEDRIRGRQLGRTPLRTFGRMKADYLLHRASVVATQTLRNDTAALNHMADDFAPATPVERLEPQRTLDRLLRQGSSVGTVRVYSAFLSSFWSWLDLPYKVKLPGAVKSDVHVWSDAEAEGIRERAGALLLAVDLGLYVGLRAGEIWGAEWRDVRGWTVRVTRQHPNRTLKGKRARTAVILPGWAHAPGEGRICEQGGVDRQRRALRDVMEAAGLEPPDRPWHSLRHTYSRMFLERQPDLRLLQASLGHASIRTTETTYDHLADRAADLAVRGIHG